MNKKGINIILVLLIIIVLIGFVSAETIINPSGGDIGLSPSYFIDNNLLSADRYCVDAGYLGLISFKEGTISSCAGTTFWSYQYSDMIYNHKWTEVEEDVVCSYAEEITCGVSSFEIPNPQGEEIGLRASKLILSNEVTARQYCKERGAYLDSYSESVYDPYCSEYGDETLSAWFYDGGSWTSQNFNIADCNLFIENIKCRITCAPTQTILKISSSENAHAETWVSWGNNHYDFEICFDGIFWETFDLNNPHDCKSDDSNLVVTLSGDTNAHADSPDVINSLFGTKVCYGDLECKERDVIDGCEVGYKEILRLYSSSNSHLLMPWNSGGDKIICCIEKVGSITEARWEDLEGNLITTTNSNSTVALAVPGENLQDKDVTYEIFKKETVWIFFEKWDETAIISTEGIGYWKPVASGTYKFEALFEGDTKESGELVVSDCLGSGCNTPPTVTISGVVDTAAYWINNEIDFGAIITDPDDEIEEIKWDLGDGTIKTWNKGDGMEAYNDATSFTHSYDATRQKTIILRVTDYRGAVTEKRLNILIINSDFILTKISKPEHQEIISIGLIEFNASKTYALDSDSTATPKKVTCVSGDCPKKVPPKIGVTVIEGEETPPNYGGINFEWELSTGYKKSKDGFNSFKVNLLYPGNYWANITSSINGEYASDISNFTVYVDNPYCYMDDEGDTYWIEDTGTSPSLDDCYREDGKRLDEVGDVNCCPAQTTCILDDDEQNICIYDEDAEEKCGDYEEDEDCTDYSEVVAKNSVKLETGYTCGEIINSEDNEDEYTIITNCRCEWDGGDDECKTNYDVEVYNEGDPSPNKGGTCKLTTIVKNNCDTLSRNRIFTILAEWVSETGAPRPDECKDDTLSQKCFSLTTKLNFFTPLNLIFTIILIAGFYLFTRKKRR